MTTDDALPRQRDHTRPPVSIDREAQWGVGDAAPLPYGDLGRLQAQIGRAYTRFFDSRGIRFDKPGDFLFLREG